MAKFKLRYLAIHAKFLTSWYLGNVICNKHLKGGGGGKAIKSQWNDLREEISSALQIPLLDILLL